MTNLEIVIMGVVPMVTLFVGVLGGLMFDRNKLTGLVKMWRGRYQSEKKASKALVEAQGKLEQAHEEKLQLIKSKQGKQFKLGVDAFLENCRTRANSQLSKNENKEGADQLYLSSLKMYATSLDATINTLNAKDPIKFQELMEPLRAQVIDAMTASSSSSSSPSSGPGSSPAMSDGFQKTFRVQEVNRIRLRGLMEEVYRGGKVVVKEKKDELVLQLEQQLIERIGQQQEMLLQLKSLEAKVGSTKNSSMNALS